MNDYHNAIAEMFRNSRDVAKLSQSKIAKKLGVSKRTVQNWEAGFSSPTIHMTIQWFRALGIPLYPYLMRILHPQDTNKLIEGSADDETCRNALMTYVKEMPIDQCRKLLYASYGSHGSNPYGVLEMITAYLHIPLSMRLNIAQSVITNYEICKAHGLLQNQDSILPNFDTLRDCSEAGRDAVLEGKNSYQ